MKIVSKSVFSFAIIGLSVFGISNLFVGSAYANPDGAPAYYTGAPRDKGTCNSCHSTYPINSGTAIFRIIGPTTYAPGQTITLKIAFDATTTVGKLWGFEMTTKDASSNRV